MTNDEKAKAYDEALERAKAYHRNELAGSRKEMMEYIFPQLRESEDERIRKYLIEKLKAANSVGELKFIIPQPAREACIAYLEKQKEQKEELVYRLNGLMQDYIKEGKDDEEKEHRLKCYQLFRDALEDTNFFEQKEQKPAELSEVELEFRGEKVKVKRPFYRDDKGRGYSTAELDEEVAWNALRAWCEKKGISIYDLYPKAEWSEEDADILNCCISSIEEAKENRYAYKETDGDTSYDHEIAWLKSLRPSWKPSDKDELMKLKYVGTSTKLD